MQGCDENLKMLAQRSWMPGARDRNTESIDAVHLNLLLLGADHVASRKLARFRLRLVRPPKVRATRHVTHHMSPCEMRPWGSVAPAGLVAVPVPPRHLDPMLDRSVDASRLQGAHLVCRGFARPLRSCSSCGALKR